jgi:Kdo2-lipid IVA lauroyltransferase/acyltransferase
LATLARDPRSLRRGIMVEGADHVRAVVRACRRGEGTVAFTGHFGNWELLSRVGATVIPATVIGRRLRSEFADAVIREVRASGGSRVLYQDDDVRASLRELRSGRMLGVLADQDVPRLAGIFVPWFGVPAFTPSAPAALTLMAGGAAQPLFLYERAGRWVLHAGPRRVFPRGRDRAADIQAITSWAMAYEEELVRRQPHQWVWWHRRWKTRPPGETA